MSQDNLTGTNILGCAAQYKTSTSYSLWVLVAENLTKYLPRDTDVPAEVPSDSGETNAHTQYWPWRLHAVWSTSRNPSSPLAEILPLNSTAPAWLSSASPKPIICLSHLPFQDPACSVPWSSWDPELLLTGAQSEWWLNTTDTVTPEGKDPIRKGAMSLHVSQAHTYTLQINPILQKFIPLCSHTSLGLHQATGTGFQPEKKATSSLHGCHGFPHFLKGPC